VGGQAHQNGYEFGEFRVDVPKRLLLLKADGRALPLSSRAFDTLLFFLEHPGELLDKSTLMAAVWPNLVVEENNLNQHISALRRTLGERPEEHRFIVTVPGRGYRFVAPVRAVADGLGPPAATEAEASATMAAGPVVSVALEGPATRVARSHRRYWAFVAAGVVLAAALAAWSALHFRARWPSRVGHTSTVTSVEVSAVRKPRLAVMPFENLSPDPDNAFFTDGLHEEIVTTLAELVPGVEVISRTTMMSYRADPPKPLAVVAHELRASHLLEGSVRRENNQIRLTLQLIDAGTDNPVWSKSYNRTLADTLSLESEVAQEVAGQLSVELIRPERRATAPIQDPQAFDLYLKAMLRLRTYIGDPSNSTEFARIRDLLQQVIDRQPNFALAYAERARLQTLSFISSQDTSEAFVSRIQSDLDIARHLAPRDPVVLAATGYFLMCENDTRGALDAYEAAEAEGLAQPEWLIPKAHLLLRTGRIEEMNATTQRMLALDPADPIVIYFAVLHFMWARQPLDALRAAEYSRPFPPMYLDLRAFVLFDFAGRTQELRSYLERNAPVDSPAKLEESLNAYFQLLRFEHRYAELRALFDRIPAESGLYSWGVDYGPVGPTPTALFRGWTDLLLGDRADALRDGQAVLRFVDKQPRTRWNRAFLEIISAAGRTFEGDCERARAGARNALSFVSRADNAVIWNTTATHAAQIDAWCGGQDEGIELLRQVSSGRPGVGPAMISRDPLFTVPLGKVPAFRELADQLEGDIRATGLVSVPSVDSHQ